MCDDEKQEILQNRANILKNTSKPDFVEPKDINCILEEIGITRDDYYEALTISTDNDFQIHFRCEPKSCFVNNYEGLLAWKSNIDIQLINHYKAVAYMSEDEASEAMKQVAKEAVKENLNVFEKMKAISKAYTTKRECSVQEALCQNYGCGKHSQVLYLQTATCLNIGIVPSLKTRGFLFNLARSELFSIRFRLARWLATKFLLLRSPVYAITKYQ